VAYGRAPKPLWATSFAAVTDPAPASYCVHHAGKGSLPAGVPANASALLQQAAQQFAPIILSAEQSAAQIQTNGIEV
jgi:hypothetical protein